MSTLHKSSTEMDSTLIPKTHILIIPFPAQGHIIPLLDFTHRLAVHGGSAVTFTVVVTPKNLSLLSPLLSRHPPSLIQTLILPFPQYPQIPEGVENVKDLPPSIGFPAMINALGNLRGLLHHWITTHRSPPSTIVSDMFLGWTHKLAVDLGIRRFVFSPSAAITCCLFNSLWLEMPKKNDKDNENEIMAFENVPNCPKYPWRQVSSLYRGYLEGDPFWEFIKDCMRDNAASHGLVVNSFAELERPYLDHLKQGKAVTGHDRRVWAVGPVLPLPEDGGWNRGGPTSVSAQAVMTWLDKVSSRGGYGKHDGVVVYVCFGSQTVLTSEQTAAIAAALEKSGVRFVWAVKEPISGGGGGNLPEGFEGRMAGRGMVIRGWAPQIAILNHRAIGAFLTHCGWNSVLESLIAGVVMLTWPMMADQFVDATLIVDQLKVGRRACEGADTVPVSDELARVLAESVSEFRVERQRAVKLRSEAVNAVRDGGSSVRDLDSFLAHITNSQS